MGTSPATSTTEPAGHDCETDPSVIVWLQNNSGGFVYADVEYSVAGGPRQSATGCQQGVCFIFEGIDQPITVYAQYEGCSEQELSTFGASCDANAASELIFGFYENCGSGEWATVGPPDPTGGVAGNTTSGTWGSSSGSSSSSGTATGSGSSGSSSSSTTG